MAFSVVLRENRPLIRINGNRMNLHEFQAKQLFTQYGITTPEGVIVDTAVQAAQAARDLGGDRWVVKAQVHAGGRGKAGGVRLVASMAEVSDTAEAMLGQQLVTQQTTVVGLPINKVWIELPSEIERELYLSAVVDRTTRRIVFMMSASGGMDIEAVAETTPEAIMTIAIDPAVGLQAYQCGEASFFLALTGAAFKQLQSVMQGVYRLFTEKDASLVEINPLVLTKAGTLVALDAKVEIDDNALYRQPDLAAMFDASQENATEVAAKEFDLNYISLDGDIACMVNGAGLAMATMDLIQMAGGEPANFLDVGGGTTADKVAEAFKLIVADGKVKSILVNIFGGIVRCDLIAEGLIQATKEVGLILPIVVRLEGTNAPQGRELLAQSGMTNLIAAESLSKAAQQAVAAAKGAAA